MICHAPNRVNVYRLRDLSGNPQDWEATDGLGLECNIVSMTNTQALAASADGRHNRQATHTMRCQPHAALQEHTLVRETHTQRCYLVLTKREGQLKGTGGGPEEMLCDLSVMDPPPTLPDVSTPARRDR